MAERRMFAKSIVLSDAFLDMPLSARCLYFTLGMLADDDGFVGNPKSIMRQCGASQDDMVVLLQKRYILSWDSGVIVIKHWRMNNYLRSDRYTETTYIEEKASLTIDEKGAYTEINNLGIPSGSQVVDTGKDSIGKYSIDKVSIGNNINNYVAKKSKNFIPPTVDEVSDYCIERNNDIDAEEFVDFYTSKGWMIGKNKMKDWKSAVRTWERNRDKKTTPKKQSSGVEDWLNAVNGGDVF